MKCRNSIIMLLAATSFIGCSKEPKVAGNLSATSVCNTAGYLIRQQLGKNLKTIDVECSVTNRGGNNVAVESGYISPLGPTFRYTALGSVSGDTLRLSKIKIHGVDDEFIPFNSL